MKEIAKFRRMLFMLTSMAFPSLVTSSSAQSQHCSASEVKGDKNLLLLVGSIEGLAPVCQPWIELAILGCRSSPKGASIRTALVPNATSTLRTCISFW